MFTASARAIRLLQRFTACAIIGAAGSACVLPAHAASTTTQPTAVISHVSIDNAAELVRSGQWIAAQDMLAGLRTASKGDADATRRIAELLMTINQELRSMSKAEVALLQAQHALSLGDLRAADRFASSALQANDASAEVLLDARDILNTRVPNLRYELSSTIQPALAQAVRDFNNSNYAQAKAGLDAVQRLGVSLSRDQQSTLDSYLQRIVDIEREQGRIFANNYIPMGVLEAANAGISLQEAQARAAYGQGEGEPIDGTTVVPVAGATTEDEVLASIVPDESTSQVEAEAEAAADNLMNDSMVFEAQGTYDAAVAAYNAGRYVEAVDLFTAVTTAYSPYLGTQELDNAEQLINQARVRIGSVSDNAVSDTVRQREIMRGQAIAETDSLVQRASTALGANDTDRALRLNSEAALRWRQAYANDLLSQSEYDTRAGEIEKQRSMIQQFEVELREREIIETATELDLRQAEEAGRAAAERATRIEENLRRVRLLQMQRQYEQALQIAEETLVLDPLNPAAQLIRDVLQDSLIYNTFHDIQREKDLSYAREMLRAEESMILPDGIYEYPETWPEITRRRFGQVSFTESAADRRILRRLESTRDEDLIEGRFGTDDPINDIYAPVTFGDWINAYLKQRVPDVIFDVDWSSLNQSGIDKGTEFVLDIGEKAPLNVVLDRVLSVIYDTGGFGAGTFDEGRPAWGVQDGRVVISTQEVLDRNTFIVVYDIRDLLYRAPNFSEAPELQISEEGDNPIDDLGEDEPDEFELDEESVDELIDLLTQLVGNDPFHWEGNGSINTFNLSLIVRTTSENHREMQTLLNKLREVQNVQISVESRLLNIRSSFFEQIGLDVDFWLNGDNNQFQTAVAEADTVTVGNTNIPGGQFLTPENVVDGSDPFGVPFVAPDSWSIIPVGQNSLGITQSLIGGTSELASTILAGDPAMRVEGTFLDDIQIDFLLEATQADERSVTMQAPRLTFLNGRTAHIVVVTQQQLVTDGEVVAEQGAVGFNPEPEAVSEGFVLLVGGVVSHDRRYVNLTVRFQISELEAVGSTNVESASAGGDDAGGGGIAVNTIQLPVVTSTTVRTAVKVPDKGTMMLGGQRLTTEVEVESGVPVLSKVPYLNRLFSNRAMTQEETTIVILVKPTILIQDEQEDDNFPGLLDEARRNSLIGF